MKRLMTLIFVAGAALSVNAQTNVGVSIGINQPGVYGRIEIGNAPPPPVVYAEPIVVVRQPVKVHVQPVYLYAPPGHQKHWKKHCHRYKACGQPVYFVKEEWVRERYEKHHHGHHHHDKKHHKEERKH